MCLCTQYDSPTCGHSWTSMTESCGYYRDLLNCPYRQTVGYLIAPPNTCPTCNCGFADGETLQMIQGPWGCNQLVRNHYGGDCAVGNGWVGSLQIPQLWSGRPLLGGGFYGGDTRSAGPYSGAALTCGPSAIAYASATNIESQRMICNDPSGACYDDCCYNCCDGGLRGGCYDGYSYKDRRRQRKHDYQYKYRRSTRDGQGCSVM